MSEGQGKLMLDAAYEIERLRKSLEAIAALPLGSHEAKRMAREALVTPPARVSEEQVACIKLDAICAHLNHPNQIQSKDLMTALKLVEDAAEWARLHIERRGKENDELREQCIQFAAHSLLATPPAEPPCEQCGKPESDSKHIKYGSDVNNPVKHHFAPVTASGQASDTPLKRCAHGEYRGDFCPICNPPASEVLEQILGMLSDELAADCRAALRGEGK